jgi:hypothetical protein
MEGSNIVAQVKRGDIFGEESSESLINILSKERNESGLDDIMEWVSEREKNACIFELTRVRARVNKVSNRVWRAKTASSTPLSPLSRRRLNRMYQFVRSSIKSNIRPTTVYIR